MEAIRLSCVMAKVLGSNGNKQYYASIIISFSFPGALLKFPSNSPELENCQFIALLYLCAPWSSGLKAFPILFHYLCAMCLYLQLHVPIYLEMLIALDPFI